MAKFSKVLKGFSKESTINPLLIHIFQNNITKEIAHFLLPSEENRYSNELYEQFSQIFKIFLKKIA